jgi:WhiB family redox-sensing transcriptional regulator
MDRAACIGIDAELFFPAPAEGVDITPLVRDAQSVCARCPVRAECLQHALTHNLEHGIWGGVTAKRRREIRRCRAGRCDHPHHDDLMDLYVSLEDR